MLADPSDSEDSPVQYHSASVEAKNESEAPKTAVRSCLCRLLPEIGMIIIIIHLSRLVIALRVVQEKIRLR